MNALSPSFLSLYVPLHPHWKNATRQRAAPRPPSFSTSTECATETAKNIDTNSGRGCHTDCNNGPFLTAVASYVPLFQRQSLCRTYYSGFMVAVAVVALAVMLYDRVPTVGQAFCVAFVSRGSISEYECLSHVLIWDSKMPPN
jgi:hypothetical protein